MSNGDGLLSLLKEMVKNKYNYTNLGKIQITREKQSLTQFTFHIAINKSVFEDILSNEEKSLLWLEGSDSNE